MVGSSPMQIDRLVHIHRFVSFSDIVLFMLGSGYEIPMHVSLMLLKILILKAFDLVLLKILILLRHNFRTIIVSKVCRCIAATFCITSELFFEFKLRPEHFLLLIDV